MREVRVGEAAVRFEDMGRGEPVLLLHGFPTSRHLWKQVAPLLVEAGFRVVAPDLVGYGESICPPSSEPDMASEAGWMLGLLDAIGVERAHIVAHDVGTAAAQVLVTGTPERARTLVMMDGVFGDNWAMQAIAPILDWQEPARLFRVLVRQLRNSGPVRLDEQTAREVLAAYEGEEGGKRLIRAARALRPEQTAHILPRLRERAVPTRILWGEHDTYLTLDDVGRPLAEALGAGLTVLPGGHFVPLDCAAAVAAAVSEFAASAR